MKKVFAIVLAGFALAACQNTKNGAGVGSETSSEDRVVETVYDIAYIKMDSLAANYDRAVDLSSAFEAKATKVQNDLNARARSLQNEMISFEDKVNKGLMTSRDAQAEQARLQTKAQQFDADSQNRQGELAEEQQVMMNQIFYAINDYVAKYNADLRYKMILTTSGGTPILHADPALDITAEILKGLNEEYAAELAAAKK
jgi:outer membrane protein